MLLRKKKLARINQNEVRKVAGPRCYYVSTPFEPTNMKTNHSNQQLAPGFNQIYRGNDAATVFENRQISIFEEVHTRKQVHFNFVPSLSIFWNDTSASTQVLRNRGDLGTTSESAT